MARALLRTGVWLGLVAAIGCLFVSNLHSACMHCLCEAATSCNHTLFCRKGYCGPFYIAHIYWVDAGRPVIKYDDPQRDAAYEDCANDYNCAKKIVTNYMAKHGKDCNGDGVTDCDDYAMIHFNGGNRCEPPINGTNFHNRYIKCRPPKTEEEALLAKISFPS